MSARKVNEKKIATLCVAAGLALAPVITHAADVFSDAKSWHRGFVDANGDGYLNIGAGKMEFPESLLIGDTANAAHTVTLGPSAVTFDVTGSHTSIVLRTETVVSPLANTRASQTVAYFPQDTEDQGNGTYKYWTAGLHLQNANSAPPIAADMADEFTVFIRFRWNGDNPIPSKAAHLFGARSGSYAWDGGGFQFCIDSTGKFNIYSAKPNLSTTFSGITLAGDKWTDFAMVAKNRVVTLYAIQEGDADISTSSATAGGTYPASWAVNTFTIGHSRDGHQAQTWTSSQDRAYGFRGSIASFAAWSRALSAEEVRQVFAWPGTDLVRLGTANDSALDFEGGAAPATINFDVAAKDAGLGQVLRVSATSTSAAGTFNVAVNGAAAGSIAVTPGKTVTLYVKKNLIVAGSNTITLTRTSADPVTIDAIALGGSTQIGNADGSWSEFAPETYGGKVFADVKSLHRGALPYHGNPYVLNPNSGYAEFPESLVGDTTSKAHLLAFNSPSESSCYFGVNGTHTGIIIRTENVVYPYAKRTEEGTKAFYFPSDSEEQGDGSYRYWTAGLHLNTNNVPFIPKFDQANDSCTFFLRFRWDGTVPIPGQPSYFMGVGDTIGTTYGFYMGLTESGRYYFYSYRPSLNKTWNGAGDVVVSPNKWTDFAIALSNRKVTIYSYQEGSSSVAVMSATATGASPASYAAVNSFVIGNGRSGGVGGGWSTTSMAVRAYGFRGGIHAFAAWDRALSADEIRQVFAWPGGRTIANLGVVNNSNAEFGSTSTESWCGFTANRISGAVDWINMRGTFDSSRNRLGLSNMAFTADDITTDMTLRFATTSGSDACSFDVYVNDAKAGSLSNVPGGTVTLALAKHFFKVANDNKVELRFVSSSGTVYTDAIQLVRAESGDYYAMDSDQSDCAFGQYELVDGAETRQPTNVHVDVPDAIAGRGEYSVRVVVRFKATQAQTLALTVNGAAEPAATFSAAASDAFQEFKADVPAGSLLPGDNVLTLSNAASQAGGSTWLGVDYFRVEAIHHVGTQFILR